MKEIIDIVVSRDEVVLGIVDHTLISLILLVGSAGNLFEVDVEDFGSDEANHHVDKEVAEHESEVAQQSLEPLHALPLPLEVLVRVAILVLFLLYVVGNAFL